MLIFDEGKTAEKPLRVKWRSIKVNPHMASSPGSNPRDILLESKSGLKCKIQFIVELDYQVGSLQTIQPCTLCKNSMDASTNQISRKAVTVAHTLYSFSFAGEYFIGLDDKAVEGEYKWTDGKRATYKNFLRQDLSSDQNRDCVLMRLNHGDSDNGKWETKECNNKLRFICQCPGECTRA